jgi:hypothetical protein
MRAPLFTIVSLFALVAALVSSSLGTQGTGAPAAPLALAESTAAVKPVASESDSADLLAPVGQLRSSAERAKPTHGDPEPPAMAVGTGETVRPRVPTAWAAYDPRAERNARYRAESLPRALVGLTAEDTGASVRVAFAIAIETAAIFTELDERRESFYVPDDGQRHPLTFLAGHHSVACGGANYVFAEGRFPLYDALVRLEDASISSPEVEAWRRLCPLEAALRSRHDEALLRLAAYH